MNRSNFFPKIVLVVLVCCLAFHGPSVPTAGAETKEKELFLVAQKAFDDGFYDVAIRYIDQFLNTYPQSEKRIQAKLLLGQCHFFKSQYLKAYEIFKDLLQYSEFQDATLFWLGETYLKGSDYSQAESQYRQLIEVYPNSPYLPQALYSLAWTYYEAENYKSAKSTYLRLIKKFPAHQLSEDASFKVGECDYNLGNYEKAIEYFKSYVLNFPKSRRHANAFFYMGESFYYLEDHLSASTYYAKTAAVSNDQKLSLLSKISLGWCYLKLKKYDLAQSTFDEAKILAEGSKMLADDIYLGQASLFTETERFPEARRAYSKLIVDFPDSPRIAEAHLGLANVLYSLKNYPAATKEYNTTIDMFADDPKKSSLIEKAYFGLAWTHLKAGKIELAVRNFYKVMDIAESKIVKVSALTQIGDAYQDTENLEKAIEVYDKVLEEHPDSIYTDYVQFRQGIALLKMNKIEAATLAFQSLEANFPKSKHLDDTKYFLGVAYFKKGDWATTNDYITRFLDSVANTKKQEFTAEARYILAISTFNLNEHERALELFNTFLQTYPDKTSMVKNAEMGVAKSLYEIGQVSDATNKFEEIIKRYSKSEVAQEALIWLGDYYFKLSKFEKAIEYYLKLVNNFPGSKHRDVILYELGQAYENLGKLEKALNYYNKITDKNDKQIYAKAKLAIADIFSKDLDPKTAIEKYRAIVESAPDFKRDAYIKIANVLKNNQKYEKAIKSYQDALSSDVGLSALSDAELQFYVADTYELLNDPAKAIEEYLKIPYLYAKDGVWSVKAYLRVARIFEDREKWEDAKTTYTKILEYKTDESKYAQERIDWITQNVVDINR